MSKNVLGNIKRGVYWPEVPRDAKERRLFIKEKNSPPPLFALQDLKKDISRMRAEEWAWLSGLLEGEGSFAAPPPSDPLRPRIALQMTDKDVVQKVADFFGLNYIQEITYPNKPKWNTSYNLTVGGSKAVIVMKKLRPLMGKRRKSQIDAALKGCKLPPPKASFSWSP